MKSASIPLLVCLVLLSVSPGHAQMGKMKWIFNARSEVVPALQKSRGNLRSTYDVIVCAARQGYSITSLEYYRNVVSGHEFDATVKDSAAFAFAFDLSSGFRPWYWKRDPTAPAYNKTNDATAKLFRDRAFDHGSNSPEVVLMRAIWLHYQPFQPERQQGYELAMRATRLAPNWADAFCWLAEACENYGVTFLEDAWPVVKNQSSKQMIVRLGNKGLRACDRAESLNSTLRPYLYLNRIDSYRNIADKNAARMIPIYADEFLRAFPDYQNWHRKMFKHPNEDIRAMYTRIAADIAKHATS